MAYVIGDHIAWQRVGDQVVLVDLESAVAIGLNPAASLILPMLEDHDEGSIVSAVVREFDIESERARRDLREFISKLTSQDVVRIVSDST